ncbi:MAG: hypothetical protein H6R27_1412 [Proteobacteria bacterium]|jgi:hypothetical protein|nr:hypothetical protein [Pseudomonadota bacterium]
MRTLIVALMLTIAPAALAAQATTYSPDWNRRPPPAWGQHGLAPAARQLDRAATELYYEVRSRTGRTEMSSRARELAEAASDLRRLAERRAPLHYLREAQRQVQYRYNRLDQRLDNKGREYRHRYAVAGLEEVSRAMRQTSQALQRYAADRPRDQDRYALNPRDPDDWRRDRDDDHDHD